MDLLTRTVSATAITIAVVAGLAACSSGDESSAATDTTSSRAAPAVGATTVKTKLLSRSAQARRARRAHGPALLGPPVVVRSVTPKGIGVLVRFRLGRQINLVPRNGGLEGTTRGRVMITGMRDAVNAPFTNPIGVLDMEDSHGFTPNSKATARGWCYGGEFGLDLKLVPSASALVNIPSGASQTIRIVVSPRGGGTTTYAVPIYDETDRGIQQAARDTKCEWE